jgi:hypothetical protein
MAMIGSFLGPCTLSLLLLPGSPGSPGGTIPTEDDAGYIRLEIRGQLLRGLGGADDPGRGPRVRARGVTLELVFEGSDAERPDLRPLYGSTVTVRGMLESRRVEGGPERLVCVVSEGPFAEVEAAEFLVGYREGRADEVAQLCKDLNLKVLERHEPGSYLRVQTMPGTATGFEKRLEATGSVRYIEKNREIRIPEPPDASEPGPGA